MKSSPLNSPIVTVDYLAGKLRLFRSPHAGAQIPWHSWDDMAVCLGFPRAVRRQFLRQVQSDWKGDVRTVATSDGLVIIAPHFMAQGMIGAAEDIGCAPRHLALTAYGKCVSVAWNALHGDMPAAARMARLMEAFKAEFSAPQHGGAA